MRDTFPDPDALDDEPAKLTTIRAMATAIGRNRELADRLWRTGGRNRRLLSLLLLDPKQVDPGMLRDLTADLEHADRKDQDQTGDWLLSAVVMKNRKLHSQVESWGSDPSIVRRRLYWQFQARTVDGSKGEQNAGLLATIEREIRSAPEQVRWTMNWCAASIGIEDGNLRERCVRLGETTGFYRDYQTPKGCTSPYLPAWIDAVVRKRGKRGA